MTPPDSPPARRRIAGERRQRTPVGAPAADALTTPRGQEAPAVDQTAARRTSPPGSARRWALLLTPLVVLAVAALAVALLVALPAARETKAVEDARSPAATAAATAAEQLLSFDYRTLDQERSEDAALLTPQFASTFEKTFTKILGDTAPTAQPVVTANVRAVATLECGDDCQPDQAQVLLFVDQVNSGPTRPEAVTDENRLVLTMRKDGDRWLVADITAL